MEGRSRALGRLAVAPQMPKSDRCRGQPVYTWFLLLQARDLARKMEVLKPLFVEPRSKGSFSEVCFTRVCHLLTLH